MLMFGVLAALLLAPPLAADSRPQLAIIVRQHLEAPLAPAILSRIAREVRTIWGAHVNADLRTIDEAADFPADDTLDLVLTDRETSRSGDGLGWIEFVDDEPARTITVSVAMAAKLADAGSWAGRPLSAWPPSVRDTFMVRALGRAVAHEVGHYLLRSKTHAPRGLMRNALPVAELMRPVAPPQRLTADDIGRLKRRAAAYLIARQLKPAEAAPR